MIHSSRTLFLGLMLGLSAASGQTMIDTTAAVGIQGTLNQIGTPSLTGAVQSAQGAAATVQAQNNATAAMIAQTTPAAPGAKVTVAVTPLTAAQQALLEQARAAYRAGNLPLARTRFETLIAQNFTNPEPHFGLALVLYAQNDLKGAAFELGQFMTMAPDRFEGPYNMGVLATRQGDHDGALKWYAEAARLLGDGANPQARRQVLDALAAEQAFKKDYAALTTTLESLAALAPNDNAVQFRLAQALTLSGRGATALPGLYALMNRVPNDPAVPQLIADIYVMQGLPDRAVRELDSALPRMSSGAARSGLLLHKAGLLAASGNAAGAVTAARDATRADSRNAAAFARLAEYLLARGDRKGAQDAALSAVRLNPQDARARATLGSIRLGLGLYDAARNDAALVLTLKPDTVTHAQALYIQGVAAYQTKAYAQARAALQASLARQASADTALWLGLTAYAQKDYAAAIDALSQSVKFSPTANARQNLASALLAGARYAEAEAILKGLVQEQAKNAEAWYLLGLSQRAQGREADARVSLRTAAGLGNTRARDALKS